MGAEFVQFSLVPILIGVFASIACAMSSCPALSLRFWSPEWSRPRR